MIDSLHSLTRSPLPAITTIKLRSNRLTSLAGVERLLSLENLDVQDNRLSDPTEAARLTGIPNLRRICVKHNAFTKAYPNYRVTIFNLFRNTPGYTEDLIVDGYEPSYSERKALIDRVPEIERDTTKQRMEEPQLRLSPPVVLHQTTRQAESTSFQAETLEHSLPRLELPNTQSDVAVASARRRRGPKKRIVHLSRPDEFAPPVTNDLSAVETNKEVRRSAERSDIQPLNPIESVAADSEHAAYKSLYGDRRVDAVPTRPPDLPGRSSSFEYNSHGEDYRQKVEALKQEFGSNWISALTEQGWDGSRGLPKDESKSCSPSIPALHRANSQAIVSSGRTLG